MDASAIISIYMYSTDFWKGCQNLFAFVSLKASAVWKNFQIAIEKVNKYKYSLFSFEVKKSIKFNK